MRFVAFLRGINISGKNKIAMVELKKEFEKLGYTDVKTYLNSGNIIFSTDETDVRSHKACIEKMITDQFGFDVPTYVVAIEALNDAYSNAPEWWGTDDKDKYHNMIFILTADSPEEISGLIGPKSEGLEYTQICGNFIFWTFDRSAYQKCNWWKKTATAGIAEKLTIRTANTIKKICEG